MTNQDSRKIIYLLEFIDLSLQNGSYKEMALEIEIGSTRNLDREIESSLLEQARLGCANRVRAQTCCTIFHRLKLRRSTFRRFCRLRRFHFRCYKSRIRGSTPVTFGSIGVPDLTTFFIR